MRHGLPNHSCLTDHRSCAAFSRSLPHTLQNTSRSCHSGDRSSGKRIAGDESRCGRKTSGGGGRGQASNGLLGKGPCETGDAASGGHSCFLYDGVDYDYTGSCKGPTVWKESEKNIARRARLIDILHRRVALAVFGEHQTRHSRTAERYCRTARGESPAREI